MNAFAVYVILGVLIPIGLPILVASLIALVKGVKFEFHLLFGGGQLCFYSTTLTLATISQVISVAGHDADKAWAILALTLIIAVAVALWAVGVAETVVTNAAAPHATRRIITKISWYIAAAAIVFGGVARLAMGLL